MLRAFALLGALLFLVPSASAASPATQFTVLYLPGGGLCAKPTQTTPTTVTPGHCASFTVHGGSTFTVQVSDFLLNPVGMVLQICAYNGGAPACRQTVICERATFALAPAEHTTIIGNLASCSGGDITTRGTAGFITFSSDGIGDP